MLPKSASLTAGPFNLTVQPDYKIRGWMWSNYSAFGFDDVIWARRIGMAGGFGYHGLVNVYGNATMHQLIPNTTRSETASATRSIGALEPHVSVLVGFLRRR